MDITPKSFQNDYEMTFILTPELSEDEQKKAADKFVKLIKEHGGEVSSIERWGMRKLAYTINKRTSGYYTYMELKADGEFINRLERDLRYDENVIRYLIVRLDKHALAYNNKRREQGFGFRKDVMEGKKN